LPRAVGSRGSTSTGSSQTPSVLEEYPAQEWIYGATADGKVLVRPRSGGRWVLVRRCGSAEDAVRTAKWLAESERR